MSNDLTIQKVNTFLINTPEAEKNWSKLSWTPLFRSYGNLAYKTQFKVLYSDNGIYFLIYCEDEIISCSENQKDFDNLYEEDVAEVFLQPNPDIPLYLEVEISPLNKELTLLVPQNNGQFKGWLPWDYQGERKVQHNVSFEDTHNWCVELFIPFTLLVGICKTPIQSGEIWHANVTRIDYKDTDDPTLWSWLPMRTKTFHHLPDFGKIIFL